MNLTYQQSNIHEYIKIVDKKIVSFAITSNKQKFLLKAFF